jgi:hypothetical protein
MPDGTRFQRLPHTTHISPVTFAIIELGSFVHLLSNGWWSFTAGAIGYLCLREFFVMNSIGVVLGRHAIYRMALTPSSSIHGGHLFNGGKHSGYQNTDLLRCTLDGLCGRKNFVCWWRCGIGSIVVDLHL